MGKSPGNLINQINLLHSVLVSEKILRDISKETEFYDEPRFFIYHTNTKILKQDVIGSGSSFESAEEAIIKSLGENIERMCQLIQEKSIYCSSYEKLNKPALDPCTIDNHVKFRQTKLGWIKGYELTQKTNCLIPAQLVYLNYKPKKQETELPFPTVTTGAAGGFNHSSTLIRAIGEVVERDAFMTMYLNRIAPPKINLKKSRGKLESIAGYFERYNLDLNVFNITSDLEIPTFLTVLVDRSGVGPAVTCGAKSDFNIEHAIIGSIQEALFMRPFFRRVKMEAITTLGTGKIVLKNIPHIVGHLKRALFWMNGNSLKYLDFLLNQDERYYSINTKTITKGDKLSKLIGILKKMGHKVFYVDLTASAFKRTGYVVYKVIIPSLQPLYLYEREKVHSLRINRLRQVAFFFGKKDLVLNRVPHPFT